MSDPPYDAARLAKMDRRIARLEVQARENTVSRIDMIDAYKTELNHARLERNAYASAATNLSARLEVYRAALSEIRAAQGHQWVWLERLLERHGIHPSELEDEQPSQAKRQKAKRQKAKQ